jgi:fumarate reductase flavoprotein subunit
VRERLHELMWEEVGIVRDAASLERAAAALKELDRELDAVGVADRDPAFNLTWHDILNLKNLVLVSRAVAASALERTDSRGAHFRADFPTTSDLAASRYTSVQLLADDSVEVTTKPVRFTRLKPGETLLKDVA